MDTINNRAALRAQAERLRHGKHGLWGCPLALAAMAVQWWMVGSLRVVVERGLPGMWTVLILGMVGLVGVNKFLDHFNRQLAHLRQDYYVNHGKPGDHLGDARVHMDTRYDYDNFTLEDFRTLRKLSIWGQWVMGAFCALFTWFFAVMAIDQFLPG